MQDRERLVARSENCDEGESSGPDRNFRPASSGRVPIKNHFARRAPLFRVIRPSFLDYNPQVSKNNFVRAFAMQ